MSKSKDSSGLITLLDVVCILITTFGISSMLAFIDGIWELNLIIVALFFFGAKLLVMGIGDVTGVSLKPVFGCLFAMLANGVVFVVNFVVGFGFSLISLSIGMVCDVLIALIIRLVLRENG